MTTESAAASGATGTPPPRWLLKAINSTHVFLHRLTGGRWFNSFRGEDFCFVTMTGAKSGRTRTIALIYVGYRDGVLLVGSMGGAPRNPSWYHNLVKHPAIEVRHRRRRLQLVARLATPEEKVDLWPVCYQHYAPYADYRKRTTRDIPIFVCEAAP
jgi:deazaflavin-dependent oxidoreductase (nitroreductase family)